MNIGYSLMIILLVIAAFFDLKYRIVPDKVSVGGIVVGLVFSLFVPQLHSVSGHIHSLGLSILGILIGGGSIYFMMVAGDLLFKKDLIGGGDVKLLAMIGAFMGWEIALLTLFLALFLCVVYGIIVNIRTIAFGPFLGLGTLICLFFRVSL